jgi:serine/threonine-protein kinase
MCTGQLPFQGGNTTAVLLAPTTDTPKPVRELNPNVPEALAELVTQLLAKDPGQRPQTARMVLQVLQTIERRQAALPPPVPVAAPNTQVAPFDETVATAPPPKPAPLSAGRRRRWPLLAAGVLLALLAGGGLLAPGRDGVPLCHRSG